MMLESSDTTDTINLTFELQSNNDTSVRDTEDTSTFATSDLDYRAYYIELLNDVTFPAFVLERENTLE